MFGSAFKFYENHDIEIDCCLGCIIHRWFWSWHGYVSGLLHLRFFLAIWFGAKMILEKGYNGGWVGLLQLLLFALYNDSSNVS